MNNKKTRPLKKSLHFSRLFDMLMYVLKKGKCDEEEYYFLSDAQRAAGWCETA